jgi:hypothetical protein
VKSGQAPPTEARLYLRQLAVVYAEAGNKARAARVARDYVRRYGPDPGLAGLAGR